jgi:hypothetical protein
MAVLLSENRRGCRTSRRVEKRILPLQSFSDDEIIQPPGASAKQNGQDTI